MINSKTFKIELPGRLPGPITTQSASFLLNMVNITRREKTKAILMFKMIKGLSPAYLQNLFYIRITQYNFRDSEAKLELSMPRTNYWKRAFCYSGALLRIRLLVGLRKLDSLGYFKGEFDQLYSSCRSGSHMTLL